MEVIVGKFAGFCAGVKRAVDMTEEVVKNSKDIYCLGEVVHNRQIIDKLETEGLKIVYDIKDVPAGSKMIIRAHGESEVIYELAKQRNIEILDTTCGNVIAIHNKIKKARTDSFIIVIGEKNHPEVIGHIGFAGENYYVIENEDDILDAYMAFEETGLSKVYVIAQTTFSSKKFDILEKEIYTNFIEADVVVDKTICNATELRQEECEKLSKAVDYMLVIGGEKSANSRKLAEVSKENCDNTYFIQTVEGLKNINFDGSKKAGIMAGASTPDYIIEEVKKYLEEV